MVCWCPCMCVPDGWLLPLVVWCCCLCVGGVLPGGVAPCGLVVRGVGVVVSMYVCVACGLLPQGVVGVVGVLVMWWFGDWWCVWCWCVGVCGVLLGGLHPLRFGVLVIWCVCANVCVILRGCCPHCGLVVLVCRWCVDWGVAPCGLVCW